MNIDTGEMRKIEDLNREDYESGKWKQVPDYFLRMSPCRRKRELKQLEYLAEVERKKREGINR